MKIIFEFVGGPMDGTTVLGKVGQQDEADRYYVLTHRGRVGQRFRMASTYAIDLLAQEELKEEKRHHFQQHRYQVTDRIEGDEEVLIRVQYVEREGEQKRTAPHDRSAEPATNKEPMIEQAIRQVVHATAKSIGESYSHCWPAEEGGNPCAAEQSLTLHVGHVLLREGFSVFAPAVHPEPSARAVDLLGLASSQDWFLAGALLAVATPDDLDRLDQRVCQLGTFWLNPRLTIDPCRGHITRLADHCRYGYGLAIGIHSTPDSRSTTDIIDFWKSRGSHAAVSPGLVANLSRLGAEWVEPIFVRAFGPHRAYYLLSVFFRIHREVTS